MKHTRSLGDDPDSATGTALDREELAGLLSRSACGDQASFAQLYDLTAARIHGLVRRIVGDSEQSDDVTRRVFMEIWRSASRFDPTCGSASSWLMSIAHRLAVEGARAVNPSHGLDSAPAQVGDVAPSDLAADVASREPLTLLQDQVIELAYFGGSTYAEVALTLKLPASAVQTHLRNGLIRLHNTLRQTRGPIEDFGKPAGVA